MYIICDVPEGATELNFTIHKYAEFDCVVLSNSDKIEDMEPDWVEHEPCLVAVFEACTIGSKLYSAATGNSSVGSLTQSDFIYYAKQRGLQLIDWEMHKDIANLFLLSMVVVILRTSADMDSQQNREISELRHCLVCRIP